MLGLTVRWSLVGARPGVEQALASYVEETSHDRFTDMAGLRFKTWRMRPGEWFEGCYVFESVEAREQFQEQFTPAPAAPPARRSFVPRPVPMGPAAASAWPGARPRS